MRCSSCDFYGKISDAEAAVIEKSVWKEYVEFWHLPFKLGDLEMHKQIPGASFLSGCVYALKLSKMWVGAIVGQLRHLPCTC